MTAAASLQPVRQWTDVATDPNDAAALAARANTLRQAWRQPVADRLAFLADRCRGKRVLDIGCVAHDEARMDSPQWLHAKLASVAERCVGVDVLQGGVDAMKQRGFEAITHDLATGLGPLEEHLPFDTIVAGELIEHIGDLDMLFRTTAVALAPDGVLILTTPNPYAPSRVRAGQRGLVWENVDHIVYAFPSGIAELAERHGLVLSEAMTTTDIRNRSVRDRVKKLRRLVQGSRWIAVGYTTRGERAVRRVGAVQPSALLARFKPGQGTLLGETFIYVVRQRTQATIE